MDELVKEYQRRMRLARDCKAEIATLEKQIAESAMGKALHIRKKLLQQYRDNANHTKKEVDRAALVSYKKDGDKSPHPCVQIKEYTKAEQQWGQPKQRVLVYIEPLEEET